MRFIVFGKRYEIATLIRLIIHSLRPIPRSPLGFSPIAAFDIT